MSRIVAEPAGSGAPLVAAFGQLFPVGIRARHARQQCGTAENRTLQAGQARTENRLRVGARPVAFGVRGRPSGATDGGIAGFWAVD